MREYLSGDDMPIIFAGEIPAHYARSLFYRGAFGKRGENGYLLSVEAFEQWCQKHNRLDVIPLMLAHLATVTDDQADDQADDQPPSPRKITIKVTGAPRK